MINDMATANRRGPAHSNQAFCFLDPRPAETLTEGRVLNGDPVSTTNSNGVQYENSTGSYFSPVCYYQPETLRSDNIRIRGRTQ